MKIPYYQINSFTSEEFLGNPAGVCLLESWLSDEQMQYIAWENQLSETAFLVPSGNDFEIRWFTPAVEVDLCGHATLASAYVLFELTGHTSDAVNFHSRSGILSASRGEGTVLMDFPVDDLHPASFESIANYFSYKPDAVYKGKTDFMLVYSSEKQIREMEPDMEKMMPLKERGIIVTAPGESVDFVSRFFAPQSGIPEDPVTGSAHTSLTPYWVERLGRVNLKAWQLSERGGKLGCQLKGDRVVLEGSLTLYSSGSIHIL